MGSGVRAWGASSFRRNFKIMSGPKEIPTYIMGPKTLIRIMKAPNILATTNRKVPFAVFQAGITRLCAFFAPACVRSLVCSCKFCSLAWRTQFLAWLRTSAGRASAWSQKIDGGMGHGWSQSSGTLEHERSRCARAVILVYCGGEDDKCTKKHEPAQL